VIDRPAPCINRGASVRRRTLPCGEDTGRLGNFGMARNGTALSGLWALCALGCAEVTVDDPPSQLDATPSQAGAADNSAMSGPGTTGAVSPGAPPSTQSPVSGGQQRPVGGMNGGTPPGSTAPPSRPPAVAPPIAASGESGDVLFSDDFEDGDDAGWIADVADGDDVVGNWDVVATDEGQAYAQLDTSSSDESWAVGGDINWTDISLQVRFRFTDASSIEDAIVMLGLRFRDKDNYYYIEYGGDGDLKIRKRVDGSEPELASESLDQTATVGQWIDVSFTAQGDTLQASVGGQLIGMAVVDADLSSGGIALGVRENAAVEFDDVRVTVP
jgi:hypothetical protein